MRKAAILSVTLIFLSSLFPSFIEAGGREKAGAGFVVLGSTLAIIGVAIRQENKYFLTEDYLYQDWYNPGRFGEELPYEEGNTGTSNGLIVMGIISAMIGTAVALTGDNEEHAYKLEVDSAQGVRLAYNW